MLTNERKTNLSQSAAVAFLAGLTIRVGLTATPLTACAALDVVEPVTQAAHGASVGEHPDAERCAALTALNLQGAPEGPAMILSAQLTEVPAMEAQRFPEDYDGLMPSAPVYDYTGRNTIAAAWFAQAFTDGHGGSVLNDTVAAIVHKSVLQHCGAQSGRDFETRCPGPLRARKSGR